MSPIYKYKPILLVFLFSIPQMNMKMGLPIACMVFCMMAFLLVSVRDDDFFVIINDEVVGIIIRFLQDITPALLNCDYLQVCSAMSMFTIFHFYPP